MRGLLAVLLLSLSIPAFPMQKLILNNENFDEGTVIIQYPELGASVFFDFRSSQNGVCRALGYRRGIPGSARRALIGGSAVKVDSKGSIVSGSHDYYKYKSITCVDKVKEQMWIGVFFQNPQHPDSFPFDLRSSQDGACISLGYDTGAPGAASRVLTYGFAAIVDSSGVIIGGSHDYYKLSDLVCLNKNH